MSEREDNEKKAAAGERGSGSGKDGQYLGEDLRRDVRVSPSLRKLTAGRKLNDEEAEALLVQTLTAGKNITAEAGLQDADTVARNIAELIIDSLDDDLITESFLSSLDLRPYLEALNGKNIIYRDKKRLAPDVKGVDTVDTSAFLEAEQERIRNQLSENQKGLDMSPEERERRIASALEYDPSTAGMMPGTGGDAASQYVRGEDEGLVDENGDFIGEEGQSIGPAMFPVAEMRALLQTEGVAGLEYLVDQEAEYGAQLGGGFFPVETTESRVQWSDQGSSRGRTIKAEALSAAQARNMLSSMTPAEVADIQHKLAAAGYFDRIQLEQGQSITFEEGFAYDEATRAAWDLMLTESIQTNTPIPTLIGQRAKSYRDTVRKERMAGLTPGDARMTKMLADDWAMSTIGRKLYQEEATELHRKMMELTRKRSTFVAGALDNETDTGLQGEYGFTEDDIIMELGDDFNKEEADTTWGRTMYALNKYVGG